VRLAVGRRCALAERPGSDGRTAEPEEEQKLNEFFLVLYFSRCGLIRLLHARRPAGQYHLDMGRTRQVFFVTPSDRKRFSELAQLYICFKKVQLHTKLYYLYPKKNYLRSNLMCINLY
jgi:hypothetical protein